MILRKVSCKNRNERRDLPDGIEQICGSAFYYCSGLTSVTIPNSVTSIGNSAFCKCSSLENVYVYWSKPISVDTDVFDLNNSGYIVSNLYVPKGKINIYKGADVWNTFANIEEHGDEPSPSGKKGDVNEDGVVDVADITSVANIILNGEAKEEYSIEDKIRMLETMKNQNVLTEDEFQAIKELF